MTGLNNIAALKYRQKREASRITIQQFRQAIGCETVRGQAKLMLGRLHYVRATAARKQRMYVGQSIVTTDGHQSQRGRSALFNDHTAWGYFAYERFRNGHLQYASLN
jgi:hypothetical protein